MKKNIRNGASLRSGSTPRNARARVYTSCSTPVFCYAATRCGDMKSEHFQINIPLNPFYPDLFSNFVHLITGEGQVKYSFLYDCFSFCFNRTTWRHLRRHYWILVRAGRWHRSYPPADDCARGRSPLCDRSGIGFGHRHLFGLGRRLRERGDNEYATGAGFGLGTRYTLGLGGASLKGGKTNLRVGMFLGIATTAGAVAGAFISSSAPRSSIAVLFGGALIFSAGNSPRKKEEQVVTD